MFSYILYRNTIFLVKLLNQLSFEQLILTQNTIIKARHSPRWANQFHKHLAGKLFGLPFVEAPDILAILHTAGFCVLFAVLTTEPSFVHFEDTSFKTASLLAAPTLIRFLLLPCFILHSLNLLNSSAGLLNGLFACFLAICYTEGTTPVIRWLNGHVGITTKMIN